MTRIQKVLRDIQDLQDFFKKTQSLRVRIKKQSSGSLRVEKAGGADSASRPSVKETQLEGIK